jgi:hypothetical protein
MRCLEPVDATDESRIHVPAFRLVVAGYTGRDAGAVDRHIQELAAHGIPAPASVPELYVLTSDLLQVAPTVVTTGHMTSGEAEPVLIRTEAGALYVGIGSDHTDRQVEKTSILASKQACPKVLGGHVWPFHAVAEVWDDLELSSTAGASEGDYQRGTVVAIRRPDDLLALVARDVADPPGALVLFMGTIPLLDGEFQFADRFSARLRDPHAGRELRCAYRVERSGGG